MSGAFADELTCTVRLHCRQRAHAIHPQGCLAAFMKKKMLISGRMCFFSLPALALISFHCGEKLVTKKENLF